MRGKIYWVWAVMICAALATVACGGKGPDDEPAAPVQTEEQLRQEAAAAERQKQKAALEERAGQLLSAARGLKGKLGADEVVPAGLEASVGALAGPIGEVDRLLGELEQAGADGFDAARQRLDAALAALEAARAKAGDAMAAWQTRQAEAASAAGEGVSRVSPKTGLIEGLDGGDYEGYVVPAVERVQRRLRRTGHYAGAVDGDLDLATMESIGRFQEEQGLQKSGVPSPMTRARLFADGD